MTSSAPIFIVACPRSGSTLLAATLGLHSNIASGPETHFFNNYINLIDESFEKSQLEQFFEEDRLKDFIDLAKLNVQDLIMQCGQQFDELTTKSKQKTIFDTLMQNFAESQGKAMWCEKTPQHLLSLETIFGFYPHAKVLCLIRDGRDVVNSLLKMPWRPDNIMANARLWLHYSKLAKAAERKYSSKNFCIIRYEDLVSKPEESLNFVFEFLDEDFDFNCFEKKELYSNPVFASWENEWKQKANEDFDHTRVGAWQNELAQDQQVILNQILKKRLEELDYPCNPVKLSWQNWLQIFDQYFSYAVTRTKELMAKH